VVGCEYDYQHRASPYVVDCEHVLLHECIREKHNARIVTNRNMYVTVHCHSAIFRMLI
jgi:hypothetical protein